MTTKKAGRPPSTVRARSQLRATQALSELQEKIVRIQHLEDEYESRKRRGLRNPLDKDDEHAYAALLDREKRELGILTYEAVKLGISLDRFLKNYSTETWR